MVFHRAKIKRATEHVVMQNNILQCSNTTKFLGLIIDNKLKWTEHITYIKNKISKSIGILYRTRSFLDKTTLLNLYYTFVFPYLIYCNEIWGSASAVHIKPLITLQKKCLRVITFSEYLAPSKPLFDSLNILRFEKLVLQRIALMMFKFSNNTLPRPIMKMFKTNNEIHTHYTRNSASLHAPKGDGEAIYNTFSFRGVYVWNHISRNVRTNVSYISFKHIVKQYIQDHNLSVLRIEK